MILKRMAVFAMTIVMFCASGCVYERRVREFKAFVESKEEYRDLVLEKLEYPRSARTRKHSREAGLGPEWDYVLMGRVDRQVHLRNLVEAIYRMDLQDEISLEVQVDQEGSAAGGNDTQTPADEPE